MRIPPRDLSASQNRWLTAAGVLALVGGVYGAYAIYVYTDSNPNFCKSCHLMNEAWDRWAVSEHKVIDCHKCHHATKVEGLRQLWLTLTERPKEVGPHAKVPLEVCEQCHRSGDKRWLQIMATAGHRVHVIQQKLKCMDCHAQSLHQFAPPAKICSPCHEKQVVAVAGMAKQHCTSCHNFLAEKGSLVPNRGTCLWCHSDSEKAAMKANPDSPMQFACSMCHNPHRANQDLRQRCRTCHADQAATVAKLGPKHSDCLTCHKPHTWKPTGDSTCRTCHGNGLKDVAAHSVPEHVDRNIRCIDCHSPHKWKVRGTETCRQCHQFLKHKVHPEGWLTRHGRTARRAEAQCTACHTQALCADCHGKVPLPHPTNWPSLHRDYARRDPKVCRRCHQPKEFCDSCHAKY